MEASIVDLRYKMSDVLKALERNETVTVLYHGKVKGFLSPAKKEQVGSMKEHPFFGMHAEDDGKSVDAVMSELRAARY